MQLSGQVLEKNEDKENSRNFISDFPVSLLHKTEWFQVKIMWLFVWSQIGCWSLKLHILQITVPITKLSLHYLLYTSWACFCLVLLLVLYCNGCICIDFAVLIRVRDEKIRISFTSVHPEQRMIQDVFSLT